MGFKKARLVDAQLKPCIKCGKLVLAFSESHLYCDDCKKESDRKRALDRYYRLKLESGKPLHSPLGAPRLPDAPVIHSAIVYAANLVDKSNRPVHLTCNKGHPLEGDNLRIDPSGRRICITCKRESNRRGRQPKPEIPEPLPPKIPELVGKERRKLEMVAPLAELWPYGADDLLIKAIAAAIPLGVPDWVRADAGQQVYLQCLEGQINEGQLADYVKSAIKSSWGEYALSLDWRRSDGHSIADRLEG